MIDDELDQPQQGAAGYKAPDSATEYESGGEAGQMDSGETGEGDIMDALRNASPAWIDQPQRGAEGYQSPPAPESGAIADRWLGNKTDYQAPFPESTDTVTTPIETPAAAPNVYTFEMFDASDKDGYKALILDGQVFGPNDNGNTPQEMGSDDFILDMWDGAEAYLTITQDPDTGDVILPIVIYAGDTPDDLPDTRFVTIGNFSVDPDTQAVTVENQLCGDYVIPNTLDVIDEVGAVFTDIESIQFTTDGSDSIDVYVEEDAPGQVTVHLAVTPNSTLDNLINTIDNAPTNSFFMKDPNGNLVSMPMDDCSKC